MFTPVPEVSFAERVAAANKFTGESEAQRFVPSPPVKERQGYAPDWTDYTVVRKPVGL